MEFRHHFHVFDLVTSPSFDLTIIGVPTLAFALVQSYRLFRAQQGGGAWRAVRSMLSLALCATFCSLIASTSSLLLRVGWQVPFLISATGVAVQKNLPAAAKLNPTRPLQLTSEDVAKAWRFPLQESGPRRWLAGARITVTPDPAHPGGFDCTERWGIGLPTWCSYTATIRLADGTEITEIYAPRMNRKIPMGGTDVRVRWPGAAKEESLWER